MTSAIVLYGDTSYEFVLELYNFNNYGFSPTRPPDHELSPINKLTPPPLHVIQLCSYSKDNSLPHEKQ